MVQNIIFMISFENMLYCTIISILSNVINSYVQTYRQIILRFVFTKFSSLKYKKISKFIADCAICEPLPPRTIREIYFICTRITNVICLQIYSTHLVIGSKEPAPHKRRYKERQKINLNGITLSIKKVEYIDRQEKKIIQMIQTPIFYMSKNYTRQSEGQLYPVPQQNMGMEYTCEERSQIPI